MANVNTLTLHAESAEWALPSRRKVGVIGRCFLSGMVVP
jgi:hypothetical protein